MLPEDIQQILRTLFQIPYENLSKAVKFHELGLAEKAMRMPAEILNQHREKGTGGTCFSLTWFLYSHLKEKGYHVYPVLCDRSYGENTHCCAVLELEGKRYLLDPGFLSFKPIILDEKETHVDTVYNTITLKQTDMDRFQLNTIYLNENKYRFTLKDRKVSEEEFIEHWKQSFLMESLTYPVVTMLQGKTHLYFQKENLFMRTREKSDQIKVPMEKMPETVERYFGIDKEVTRRSLEVFY